MIEVTYLDYLTEEFGLNGQSAEFRRQARAVLAELSPETQLFLRGNPKLQVEIVEGGPEGVWAYFPIDQRRLIAQRFTLRPTTRVLLVLCSGMFEQHPHLDGREHFRDHLGHTLLYLRNPKARNECVDAAREYKECCRL